MGKSRRSNEVLHMNQMNSYDNFSKRNSNDNSYDSYESEHLKGFKGKHLNELPVKERDYMIKTAMERCRVGERWRGVIARGANYIHGNRFWTLVEYSEKAKNPAKYLIKSLNAEMWAKR